MPIYVGGVEYDLYLGTVKQNVYQGTQLVSSLGDSANMNGTAAYGSPVVSVENTSALTFETLVTDWEPSADDFAEGVQFLQTQTYTVTSVNPGTRTTSTYTCELVTSPTGSGVAGTCLDPVDGSIDAIGDSYSEITTSGMESTTSGVMSRTRLTTGTGEAVKATAAWVKTSEVFSGGTEGTQVCDPWPTESPYGWSAVGASATISEFNPLSGLTPDNARPSAVVASSEIEDVDLSRTRDCETTFTGGTSNATYTCQLQSDGQGTPTCAPNTSLGLPSGELLDTFDITTNGVNYQEDTTETQEASDIPNDDYVDPGVGFGSATFAWSGTLNANAHPAGTDVTGNIDATGDAVVDSARLVDAVTANDGDNAEARDVADITISVTYTISDSFDNNGQSVQNFDFTVTQAAPSAVLADPIAVITVNGLGQAYDGDYKGINNSIELGIGESVSIGSRNDGGKAVRTTATNVGSFDFTEVLSAGHEGLQVIVIYTNADGDTSESRLIVNAGEI